ncbi:MAG: hypothetical protein FWD68_06995 [Alphaproteobacteria bacterium]|nr:hypothetical protein [Alphaproteobacteria bacterium]
MAIGDQAPQRLITVVEIVLERESGRSRSVGRKGRAAPIEIVFTWRHHDNRNATTSDERKHPIGRSKIVESEGLGKEATDKASCGLKRRILQFSETVEMGLTDPKGQ